MNPDDTSGRIGVVCVPLERTERVRAFASSLIEEQTPDVEGYATFVKGIGGIRPDRGGISRVGTMDAYSGTGCSLSDGNKDFECSDND